MSKQLLLGSVLGGIVLFVWSAIAWMLIPRPDTPAAKFQRRRRRDASNCRQRARLGSVSRAYMLMQLGALVIGWFLASLVIAKFVGSKAAAA